jgi:hypothetical protein
MSRGARWTIGVFAVGCAVIFAWLPSQGIQPLGAYCAAAFLTIVAALCFVPATAPLTARLVGGVLLLVCVAYLIDVLRSPPDPNGVTTPWRAVKAMLLFGLPGGYLMIFGRYPLWGRFDSSRSGPRA